MTGSVPIKAVRKDIEKVNKLWSTTCILPPEREINKILTNRPAMCNIFRERGITGGCDVCHKGSLRLWTKGWWFEVLCRGGGGAGGKWASICLLFIFFIAERKDVGKSKSLRKSSSTVEERLSNGGLLWSF